MKNAEVVYQFNLKKNLFKLQKTHRVLIVKAGHLIHLMEIILVDKLSVWQLSVFSGMKPGQNFGSVDVTSLTVNMFMFVLFYVLSWLIL